MSFLLASSFTLMFAWYLWFLFLLFTSLLVPLWPHYFLFLFPENHKSSITSYLLCFFLKILFIYFFFYVCGCFGWMRVCALQADLVAKAVRRVRWVFCSYWGPNPGLLFFILLIFWTCVCERDEAHVYMCTYMCGGMHSMNRYGTSPCGFWESNQIFRFGGKHPYPLRHLTGSQVFLLKIFHHPGDPVKSLGLVVIHGHFYDTMPNSPFLLKEQLLLKSWHLLQNSSGDVAVYT